MTPLLLIAMLTLHAPTPPLLPRPREPSVAVMLDRPVLDARPARASVLPRPGARVLARRRGDS